jgi:hypothetical protein
VVRIETSDLASMQGEFEELRAHGIGRWYETGLDPCTFDHMSGFPCLRRFGNQVAVPYEQSPHI